MSHHATTALLVVLCSPAIAQGHSMETIHVCQTELAHIQTQVEAVSERYIKQQRSVLKRRSVVAHTEKHMNRWIELLQNSQHNNECTLQQKARLMQFQFDLERLLDP